MNGLLERIGSGEVLVADGAMGTLLLERGLKPGACPEELNLTQPDVVREIAILYARAGAHIVHTNTFGASPLKLSEYVLTDRTSEINRAAVEVTRAATAPKGTIVSASCGPTGKILEPYGDTDPGAVKAAFTHQISSLAEAGIDALTIETMTDLNEATLAIQAAREVSSTLPILATMTFDPTPRGFYTVMGVSVDAAVRGLTEAGADIIGSNCGNGIDGMIEIAREFRECTEHPLIIQSNAGQPRLENDRPVYEETPQYMAERCARLLDLGVSVLGGCCGTTPAHVTAIRRVVDRATNR